MLQLVARSERQGSPTVTLRWCISKELLDELADHRAVLPHLLLVVAKVHDNRVEEVERRLIPLDQVMDFIDFHQSGKHSIQGVIVWHAGGNIRMLRAVILGGRFSGNIYQRSELLDEEGNLLIPQERFELCDIHVGEEAACIDIKIAEGHFATAPWLWESFWVNLWFERPPRDQCAFRKRRMLAYSIQLPVVFLYLLALTLLRVATALWWISFARRGLNLRPIYHPWMYETDDIYIWSGGKGTFFTHDSSGKQRKVLWSLFCPFAPIMWMASSMFLLGLSYWQIGPAWSLSKIVLMSIGVQAILTIFLFVVVGCAISIVWLYEKGKQNLSFSTSILPQGTGQLLFTLGLAAVVVLAVLGLSYFFYVAPIKFLKFSGGLVVMLILAKLVSRGVDALVTRLSGKLKPMEVEARRDALRDDLRALLCDGRPLKVGYDALPAEKKTLYLWYRETKAKVCKPFAARQFS